jgi:RNA-splicing ligase RtcB
VIKSLSTRGVAEEASGAYKSIDAVVEVAEQAGWRGGWRACGR